MVILWEFYCFSQRAIYIYMFKCIVLNLIKKQYLATLAQSVNGLKYHDQDLIVTLGCNGTKQVN